MRVLLDENFPLALHRSLVRDGFDAEHLVLGAQRGASDRDIRARLEREPVLFLTQDTDFLVPPAPSAAVVLVSRVPQSLPRDERVAAWRRAIDAYLAQQPPGRIFEVVLPGVLRPAP